MDTQADSLRGFRVDSTLECLRAFSEVEGGTRYCSRCIRRVFNQALFDVLDAL